MSRCISCDSILNGSELSRKNDDGSFTDLCNECHRLVQMDIDEIFVSHDYAFAELTENLFSELGIPPSNSLVKKDAEY